MEFRSKKIDIFSSFLFEIAKNCSILLDFDNKKSQVTTRKLSKGHFTGKKYKIHTNITKLNQIGPKIHKGDIKSQKNMKFLRIKTPNDM